MSFRFAYPSLLIVLLVLIALWSLYMWRRKSRAIEYPQADAMIRLAGVSFVGRLPLILRTSVLILLALGAARPQFYNVSREIESPGVDIVICLDTSGSMRAIDFKLDGEHVDRLTAVKSVVSDFIEKREHDRISLVVFGQEAFTQAPLTMDKGLLLDLVDRMQIGMAGDATAVGSAIAIGSKRLKDLDAPSKIMILLTDGENNAGELSPRAAAEAAAALGIKIYTIGVGGTGEAPFMVDTLFGKRVQNYQVSLDEESLKEIASISGGRYFLASDTQKLSEIYDIIDQAEKSEVKIKEFFNYRELYRWFLMAALLLLALELILKATVLGVIP